MASSIGGDVGGIVGVVGYANGTSELRSAGRSLACGRSVTLEDQSSWLEVPWDTSTSEVPAECQFLSVLLSVGQLKWCWPVGGVCASGVGIGDPGFLSIAGADPA